MTRAPAADQARLLDLQALDSTLSGLEHRRATLPEAAEAAALAARVEGLGGDAVVLETRVGDLDRQVARAEADVATVRARADRDRARLQAGGAARDLVGLQHELESLARRQGDLEEVELELMERREADAALLDAARRQLDAARAALADAVARRDAIVAGMAGQYREARARRTALAGQVDAALVALYEKLRPGRGGVGAAALVDGRCQGCRLALTPADLAAVRAAPPDEVVRCEECGRILVRPAAS